MPTGGQRCKTSSYTGATLVYFGAMRAWFLFASALLLSSQAVGQSSPSAPEIVVVPNGNLRLKAFLWRPAGRGPFPALLFNHGSGSTDSAHTGELVITEAAKKLAPVFVKHGYAFL